MTHLINELATCATKSRIGERVELIEYAPNGRAAQVVAASGRKEWLPARWLSEAVCEGDTQSCADSANKENAS